MLITRLPEYNDGSYTEDDVAKLLMPFGFQYLDHSIYVVPQTCMVACYIPALVFIEPVRLILKEIEKNILNF